MLGTVVNCIAIIAGSFIGIIIKGNINERYKSIVMSAVGLCVFFLGAKEAVISMQGAKPILFIISLAVGSLAGEIINIEEKIEKLGDFFEEKLSKGQGNNDISKGFVVASIMYCVGTMAILGSIESGVKGEHTLLFTKSILDGISAIIFASTFGIGVMFSSLSIFVYQGTLTLLSSFIEPFLTDMLLQEINIIGGILISALGLNLLDIKKMKVGNMLPSILIPPIYFFILNLF